MIYDTLKKITWLKTPFLALFFCFFLFLPIKCYGIGNVQSTHEFDATEIYEGQFYYFDDSINPSYYRGVETPSHSWYGIFLRGELGNATSIGSHSLGNYSGNWSKLEFDKFPSDAQSGEKYYFVISESGDCTQDVIDYFGGSSGYPSGCDFHAIGFYFGNEGEEILFYTPKGAYPQNNFTPTFEGQFSTHASSTWNYINVEMTQHESTATSSVESIWFLTFPISNIAGGLGQHFLHGIQGVDDACYSYRARFVSQYGGLGDDIIKSYSQFFTDDDWIFCTGTDSIHSPPEEGTPINYDYGFSDIINTLSNKPPFGYFTSVKNALSELSTTTPIFNFADMGALYTNVFSVLRTGLAWILWFLFAFWLIRRIGIFDF